MFRICGANVVLYFTYRFRQQEKEEEAKSQSVESLASLGRRAINLVQARSEGGGGKRRVSSARSKPRRCVTRPGSGRATARSKSPKYSAGARAPSKRDQRVRVTFSEPSSAPSFPESNIGLKGAPQMRDEPSALPELSSLNLSSLPPLPPRVGVLLDTKNLSNVTSESEVSEAVTTEDPEAESEVASESASEAASESLGAFSSGPAATTTSVLSGVFTPLWSSQRPPSAGLRPKKPSAGPTSFYFSSGAQPSNFRNFGGWSMRDAFNFRHFQPRPRSARNHREEVFVIRNGKAADSSI